MGDLFEVLRAKIKIDIMKGLIRQKRETGWINFQNGLTFKFRDADKFFGQQPVLCLIGTNRKRFLIMKRGSHRL